MRDQQREADNKNERYRDSIMEKLGDMDGELQEAGNTKNVADMIGYDDGDFANGLDAPDSEIIIAGDHSDDQ